jgi:hypothetical protein
VSENRLPAAARAIPSGASDSPKREVEGLCRRDVQLNIAEQPDPTVSFTRRAGVGEADALDLVAELFAQALDQPRTFPGSG